MRLIRSVSLLLLLVIGTPAAAQVLWTVTDDEGHRNWLLGTVHSEDPRLLEFPEPLLDALKQADRLALELVPNSGMLEKLQEAMHYDEGRLQNVLPPDLYEEAARILDEHYGVGEPATRRMRPWAVAMTLSMPPPETGLFMDLALSFRASGLGLDVVALETLDEQLTFLTGLSEEGQIDLIRMAVEDFDQMRALFDELVTAYLEGDLEQLERISDEQLEGVDEAVVRHFNEVGLKQRNHIMVERAKPYLEQGDSIIAVGALHLPGEEGLIRLLEQEGYTVEGVYP